MQFKLFNPPPKKRKFMFFLQDLNLHIFSLKLKNKERVTTFPQAFSFPVLFAEDLD